MSKKEEQGKVADSVEAPAEQQAVNADKSPDASADDSASKDASAEKTGGKKSGKQSGSHSIQVADDKETLSKLIKTVSGKPDDDLILVPVDFSPHSEAALVFAAKLAEKTAASLVILHVVHDPGEMPGYYSKLLKKKRVDRIQDIAKDVFHDFVKQAVSSNPDLKPIRKAEKAMVIGLPVTRILQVTEKLNPFMVVMGSQGRTGLKHLILGSKAEQVVHLCPAPVTIVKNNNKS